MPRAFPLTFEPEFKLQLIVILNQHRSMLSTTSVEFEYDVRKCVVVYVLFISL